MPIQRMEIDFSAQSKEYAAKQQNAQVCRNWYSILDEDGKFKKPLFPFPGTVPFSNISSRILPSNINVRGLYSLNGVLYGVVGSQFRIYNDNGDFNVIGNLNTSEGLVEFMANDNQIFIADRYYGYVYQLVTTSSRTAKDFFVIYNASSFIGAPVFDGFGINDMSSGGIFSGTNYKKYRIKIDGQATASISTVVFTGTGLNDMSNGGTYTAVTPKSFRIQIDSVPGGGHPDTYKWSTDGGATWIATAVPIVSGSVTLSDGVYINFKSTTGHHLNDYWSFDATPAGASDTFKWSEDEGNTWVASGIAITGLDQALNYGVTIIFSHTKGHIINDFWDFQVSIGNDFFVPIIPIYLDSYGIFVKNNTQIFYISSTEDFSQINALDYSSTNRFPDNLVCGTAINQEILFINQFTSEIWYDTGAVTFPLQPRPNLLINWGTSAPHSLATASNNTAFWLAQSKNGGRVVVAMQNYNVQTISDKALNDKLQSYGYIDDAIGMVIEWTGKIFYFLTFPSQDITWVFDYDAKCWRQRSSHRTNFNISPDLHSLNYIDGRYFVNCHVYHNGGNYVGDFISENIYKLSNDSFVDTTNTICNEVTTAPFHDRLNRISIHSLEISFEMATQNIVGRETDQRYLEPTIMIKYSKDGGYTWSSEIWRTIGKVGEKPHRLKINKIGMARDFVFNIKCTDPVYKVLLGAIIEFEDTGS